MAAASGRPGGWAREKAFEAAGRDEAWVTSDSERGARLWHVKGDRAFLRSLPKSVGSIHEIRARSANDVWMLGSTPDPEVAPEQERGSETKAPETAVVRPIAVHWNGHGFRLVRIPALSSDGLIQITRVDVRGSELWVFGDRWTRPVPVDDPEEFVEPTLVGHFLLHSKDGRSWENVGLPDPALKKATPGRDMVTRLVGVGRGGAVWLYESNGREDKLRHRARGGRWTTRSSVPMGGDGPWPRARGSAVLPGTDRILLAGTLVDQSGDRRIELGALVAFDPPPP